MTNFRDAIARMMRAMKNNPFLKRVTESPLIKKCVNILCHVLLAIALAIAAAILVGAWMHV